MAGGGVAGGVLTVLHADRDPSAAVTAHRCRGWRAGVGFASLDRPRAGVAAEHGGSYEPAAPPPRTAAAESPGVERAAGASQVDRLLAALLDGLDRMERPDPDVLVRQLADGGRCCARWSWTTPVP